MGTAAQYQQMTQEAARRHFGDSPLAATFYRLIQQESGFAPDVVEGRRASSAGAQGIGQFMPATARGLGIDPLNPAQALDGAARYLKQQIQYFGGDVTKGVAAYNAGAGNVENAVRRGGANWTRALPAETQTYLSVIRPSGTTNFPSSAASYQNTAQTQIAGIDQRIAALQAQIDKERDTVVPPFRSTGKDGVEVVVPNAAAESQQSKKIGVLTTEIGRLNDMRKSLLPYAFDKGEDTSIAAGNLQLGRDKFDFDVANSDRSAGMTGARLDIDLFGALQDAASATDTALLNRAGTALKLITENRQQAERYADYRLRLGDWGLKQAQQYLTANDAKAATALKLSGTALEAAGFIQKAQMEVISRILPPEVKYQPGFEPDGPMAQLFGRIGLKATVLPVKQVDAATLDPRRTLADTGFNRYMQQAEGALAGYDTAAARASAGYDAAQQGLTNPQSPYYLERPTAMTEAGIGLPSVEDITNRQPEYAAGMAGVDTGPLDVGYDGYEVGAPDLGPALTDAEVEAIIQRTMAGYQTNPPARDPGISDAEYGTRRPAPGTGGAFVEANTTGLPGPTPLPAPRPQTYGPPKPTGNLGPPVSSTYVYPTPTNSPDRVDRRGQPAPRARLTGPARLLPTPEQTDPRGFYGSDQQPQPTSLSYRDILNRLPRAA